MTKLENESELFDSVLILLRKARGIHSVLRELEERGHVLISDEIEAKIDVEEINIIKEKVKSLLILSRDNLQSLINKFNG